MRQAIGYIRVSRKKQGESGVGMDGQRAQIEKYAQLSGHKLTKIFREVASGMGDGELMRPEFVAACDLSKRTGRPIIVASLDRVCRNVKAFEEAIRKLKLKVISAKLGPDADSVVIQAQAARDQREGELIGERTKAKLDELRAQGVKLGNRKNLAEAQQKGAAANSAIGRERLEEFMRALAEVRQTGASSVKEIAAALNRSGHRTARGGEWAEANVHRMLKNIREAPLIAEVNQIPAPKPKREPISSPSRHIIPSGADRIQRIMNRRNLKFGDVMREMGLNPLDASVSNAVNVNTRVKPEKLEKLQDWVEANEASFGLQ
jgi:DNA invertase Pin-like site-specific DNA recombinase